jgi:hypothetical protein
VIVRLETWEREWAEHVARKRNEANVGKADAAHYDPARMEDNLVASIAACVSELAVAKACNLYWDGSYWPSARHREFAGRADVGANVEVRRTRKASGPLVIRRRDVERGRVMALAFPFPPEFVEVRVVGTIGAARGWELGSPADYSPADTRLVKQSLLTKVVG